MEFPNLGKHCSKLYCNKLDFLPIKCNACNSIFCEEHYTYSSHDCTESYKKDNQVPACPLCNKPIPVPKGSSPDFVVGSHIDSDCQSDPAISRRKVFTNRCSYKKCKVKEVVPVICDRCKKNYCLKHRHCLDHNCDGGNNRNSDYDEDEALARALAFSMQQENVVLSKKKQEELDFALARQLQASEPIPNQQRSDRDRCNVS